MQLAPVLRKASEIGVGLTAIATLILTGCGGGSGSSSTANNTGASSVTTTITPYKGRFQSGNVRLKDASGNNVNLTGGTINASGVATVTYNAGVSYPLTVQVDGTYIDETTGTSAVMPASSPLTGMIPAASDAAATSGVPVTPVTHMARQTFNAYGFSPASAVAAITAVASNVLGTSNYAAAMQPPVFNPVDGKTSDPLTIKLTALAHTIAQQGSGVTLADRMQDISTKLAAGSAVNAVIPQLAFQSALTAINGGASSVLPAGALKPTIALHTMPSASLINVIAAMYTCPAGQTMNSSLQCISASNGNGTGNLAITFAPHEYKPFRMSVTFSGSPSGTTYLHLFCKSTPGITVSTTSPAYTQPNFITTRFPASPPLELYSMDANAFSQNIPTNPLVFGSTYYCKAVASDGTPQNIGNILAQSAEVSFTPSVPVLGRNWGPGYYTGNIEMASLSTSNSQFMWFNGNVFNKTLDDKNVASLGTVPIPSGQTAIWGRSTWSGSQYVAVGGITTSPLIASSPDGNVWTIQTANTGNASSGQLNDIAYSPTLSRFVAVGMGGSITTSTDGINWAAGTSGTTDRLLRIIWNGSKFIAVGGNSVVTSADGINWTVTVLAVTLYPNYSYAPWGGIPYRSGLMDVASSGTLLIAVGNDMNKPKTFTSNDGVNWIIQSSSGAGDWLSTIVWTGARFMAGGKGIFETDDGVTWVSKPSPYSSDNLKMVCTTTMCISSGSGISLSQ